MLESQRQTLFHILHKPLPHSHAARWVNYSLAALIVITSIAVALETLPALSLKYRHAFVTLEIAATGIFIVEYLLRLWVCVEQTRLSHPLWGRLRYALQPLPLLDLIVIITCFAPLDLRFLRVFRLTRLLRVMHLDEYDQSFQTIWHAIQRRKNMLIVSVILMLIAIYWSAALLYMVEHSVQPDKFGSIPETLWWAVVTLTTIGYGDITPITPLGKIIAGILAIFGIGIFALPTAIMTAAILDAGTGHSHVCPRCGHHYE